MKSGINLLYLYLILAGRVMWAPENTELPSWSLYIVLVRVIILILVAAIACGQQGEKGLLLNIYLTRGLWIPKWKLSSRMINYSDFVRFGSFATQSLYNNSGGLLIFIPLIFFLLVQLLAAPLIRPPFPAE